MINVTDCSCTESLEFSYPAGDGVVTLKTFLIAIAAAAALLSAAAISVPTSGDQHPEQAKLSQQNE
jgi:hypothetical protein